MTALNEAPPAAMTAGDGAHIGFFVANVWRRRELLRHLMVRNIKAQYKQSLLGYAWIILNPIAQLGIMSFVFTTALHPRTQSGSPYPLFLFIGLLPWIFFTNAVAAATDSIVASGALIRAVYFPRELLVLSAIFVRIVDLLAGLVILAVLMAVAGQPVLATVAWLPLLFFIHLLFIVGLALPLAAFNLYFRDVRYLVGTALQLWFFITPIFYSITAVPHRYALIYDLNPNARLIQAYRWALLQGVAPPITSMIWSIALGCASLLAGYYLFKKLERKFADYL